MSQSNGPEMVDAVVFMKSQIITYMGNKRKLLPYIEAELDELKKVLGKRSLKLGDGFSGSGVVSRLLKTKASALYTNDIAGYSKTLNECYLSVPSKTTQIKIKNYIDTANKKTESRVQEKWISKHWSPKNKTTKEGERAYFTAENGQRIDAMRDYIETIPKKYKPYVLAPLLVECSIHNNTNGQFSAYYKDKDGKKGEFGGKSHIDLKRITKPIHIPYPIFHQHKCDVQVTQMDAVDWAKSLPKLDVVYYDPPYNKHPYNIYYFMLDIIHDWDKTQEIPSSYRGQPKTRKKSAYNSTVHAKKALQELIENTNATYMILSYNDGGIISIPELDTLLLENSKSVKKIPIDHKTYNRLKGISNYKREGEYKPVKEYLYIVEMNV